MSDRLLAGCLEKVALLTRPTPAATSPTRSEPAKTPLRPGTRLFPCGVLDTREALFARDLREKEEG
jgi:hypothetical protein